MAAMPNVKMPDADQVTARPRRRVRALLLHVFRVALFCVVIFLIHDQHRWYIAQQTGEAHNAITLERVQQHFPKADSLSDWQPAHGGRNVLSADGVNLGFVIQTSPTSDSIVGFSGPTNTMIAFDMNNRIIGIDVLTSGDTKEHLADVLASESFMHAFDEMTWDQASERTDIDAVSGATLTSLAIAEGVTYRLGGADPPPRFPDLPELADAKEIFPDAAKLEPDTTQHETEDDHERIWRVLDGEGNLLGTLYRTTPAADQIIGYQGPTDTLIAIGLDGKVQGIAIHRSYDNPKYVGWIQQEFGFLVLFNNLTLSELANFNAKEVEGVSGATMTSKAIARGVVAAAKAYEVAANRKPGQEQTTSASALASIRFRARDVGTIIVIVVALLIAFTPLKKQRALRIVFQLVLIVYLGLINGDMVSQSLLVGWSQSGVPYRFAPGIILLVAAALLVPIFSKKQLYCHELCPHGALQELIKNRLPLRKRFNKELPRRFIHTLEMVPALLLLWVVIVAMGHLPFSLVGIEPFDAYIVRIAGWATITVAVVGLIASLFVPMAYCRFGCPTGALLKSLRFNGASDRFHKRDAAALLAVAVAVFMRFSQVSL